MTARLQAGLLILALALGTLPFAAAHPLLTHIDLQGRSELTTALFSPGCAALLAMAVAAVIPWISVSGALARTWRSERLVRELRIGAERRSWAGVDYLRVPDSRFVLMTAGFWRPAILVSRAAEAALSGEQLAAALLHEESHRRRHDVFWRWCLTVLTSPFTRVPGIDAFARRAVLRSECLADDEAVALGAGRAALFDAMVTAASAGQTGGGANLADGTTEFRLLRLARRDGTLPSLASLRVTWLVAALAALPTAGHLVLMVGLVCNS